MPDRHELQELPIDVLQLPLRALGKVSPASTIFERPPAFLEEGIPKPAVFLRPFSVGQIYCRMQVATATSLAFAA